VKGGGEVLGAVKDLPVLHIDIVANFDETALVGFALLNQNRFLWRCQASGEGTEEERGKTRWSTTLNETPSCGVSLFPIIRLSGEAAL
jgi:hypothetical protein